MFRSNLRISQNIMESGGTVRNEFQLWDEWGNYLGAVCLPSDGRYIDDLQCLEDIAHTVSVRWELCRSTKKHEHHSKVRTGIQVKQVDNVFHLATVNGIYVAYLLVPNDGQHLENMMMISSIAYTLGQRWGLLRKAG